MSLQSLSLGIRLVACVAGLCPLAAIGAEQLPTTQIDWDVRPVAYQLTQPAMVEGGEPVPVASTVPLRPEQVRPIGAITVHTAASTGKLPENVATAALESGSPELLSPVRYWPLSSYHWAAAVTRHQPLYFEEVNAERYGYTCWAPLQPVVSTAHFFGTLPALPYLMGADCPCECQYTLGHYRPGSCVPWRRHWWPVSARGAVVQAGVVTGTAFVIP